MMNQMLLDTETMVGVTVLAAMALTAVVLTVRTKLTRVPVRQTVRLNQPRENS